MRIVTAKKLFRATSPSNRTVSLKLSTGHMVTLALISKEFLMKW